MEIGLAFFNTAVVRKVKTRNWGSFVFTTVVVEEENQSKLE